MKVLHQGAEAIISLSNDRIIKERTIKEYRIKQLDEKLRRQRTRKEAKILGSLENLGIPGPKIFSFCDKKMIIEIEYINGAKLSEAINKDYSEQAGRIVALLHKNNIVHQDLTTANFLVKENKVFILDFGLSFVSERIEDKAVDLHLFERSLEAHHTLIKKECWEAFLKGYKENPQHELVLKQFLKVTGRGRNKDSKTH